MTTHDPIDFTVSATRNNVVVHQQQVSTRAEAEDLKARFEQAPHTTAEIEEHYDKSETDLTTHTRELIQDLPT